MDNDYPYGEMQVHEALADLDRRLKALEPKPIVEDQPEPVEQPEQE